MYRTAKSLFSSASVQLPVVASFRRVHTEVKVPVPWGHVAGKWWNKDEGKPIIALHGWQDNANSFDRLVPSISPKASVLAIDLPGHGHSSHFPHGFPYHRMSAVMTLRRIVEHFGWKSVTLMGHSLGGQTCFMYAAIYPGEVDSLITIDILAPIPLNPQKYIKHGGKTIDEFIRRDLQTEATAPSHPYEDLVKMVLKSPISPDTVEGAKILMDRGSVKTEEGKYRLTRDTRLKGNSTSGWSADDILKYCLELKTNILCIKAEGSPYFSTKEFFDQSWENVTKAAKNAELVYLPGKHHLHLENVEAVAPVVNKFLSKYYTR
ncbi:probable serine hydrolase [Thrips palmi]|uniref:Probable serine hydrolase n=1 Tax=Thrips palmi TaxID=161013 RepID=A0A6P8ZV08_THRPL|nr:probable serine hydrolase [Thrips palmi]